MTPEEIVEAWMARISALSPSVLLGGVMLVFCTQFLAWLSTRFSYVFLLCGLLAYGAYASYTVITYATWRAWRRRPIKPPERLRFLVLLVAGSYFLSFFYFAGMLILFVIQVFGFHSPDIGRAMSVLVFFGYPVIIVVTLLRAPQLNRGIFNRFLPKRQLKLKDINPLWVLLTFLASSLAVVWGKTEMGMFLGFICMFILFLVGLFFLAVSIGCLYQFGVLMRAGIADALEQRGTLA